jgi:PAS domain S-box-containing protein
VSQAADQPFTLVFNKLTALKQKLTDYFTTLRAEALNMNPLNQLFRQSEKSYMELFSLSPQPMWIYDIETLAFLDVNTAAIQHYGYSLEEFLGMTIKDIRPPEDVQILEEALRRNHAGRPTASQNIYRHLNKKGEIIDVQIHSNLLEFDSITAVLVHVHDISSILRSERELQRSREELLKSERRFKALVQEGSDLTAVIDLYGNYHFVSENYKSIIGYSPDELIGRNALEFIHPDDRDRISMLLGYIHDEKQILVEPFRFKHGAEDHWRWITTTATNLMDDPSVMGIVINSRDITSSIEQSIELKLSNERYKLVLKASDEAICDWDIENDVVDWGSGFHDIFGYDLSVYNNNLLSENIHEDDKERVLKEMQDAIDDPNKEIYYSEYRYYKANRQVINIQHRGIFLRNEQGKAIRSVDTLKDITAHIQRIEHIEKQNKQLKQIAWTQSHNVRGPLARILALADLLNAENDVPECQKQLLKYLIDSATELDDAIKDIIKKAE